MKKLALLLPLLLAACESKPLPQPKQNLAHMFVSLIEPGAKCWPVATDVPGDAPDTAYCQLGTAVVWCEAWRTKPPLCRKLADRPAEKTEPAAPTPLVPPAPAPQ